MHEFSVAQNIVEGIRSEIGSRLTKRIRRISMEIGRLSGISIESLEFSLQVLLDKKGVDILSVREIEPLVKCLRCGEEYSPEDMVWICPQCTDMHGEILKGNEIKIIDVEVEDED